MLLFVFDRLNNDYNNDAISERCEYSGRDRRRMRQLRMSRMQSQTIQHDLRIEFKNRLATRACIYAIRKHQCSQ